MRFSFSKTKILKTLYKLTGYLLVAIFFIYGVLVLSNCVYKNYAYPLKYKDEVFASADYYGLDRALVFSVIRTESGFKKDTVSDKGAIGLMQITLSTANYVADLTGAESYDLKDVKTNLDFGCYYLKYLFGKFSKENTVLAAYNAGEGRVMIWLKDINCSDDGETLKNIPYKETERYVEKINESLIKYRKLYGKLLDKQKKFE